MTPLLTIIMEAPLVEAGHFREAVLRKVPLERRDRLVLPWSGPGAEPPYRIASMARSDGFKRVRLRFSGQTLDPGDLDSLVRAGVNELDVLVPAEVPGDMIESLAAREGLLFTIVSRRLPLVQSEPMKVTNSPFGADEAVLLCDSGANRAEIDDLLDDLSDLHRFVCVRGVPLCLLKSLDPKKVMSNTLEARVPPGTLAIRFEQPGRVFFEPCHGCSLALACDGFAYDDFKDNGGRSVEVRPFEGAGGLEVKLSPDGIVDRVHPPTTISGRTHLLGVECGARECGRMVVPRGDMERQLSLIGRLGLEVRTLGPSETPCDKDQGAAGERPEESVHVFFSAPGGSAAEAATLQREYTEAENSPEPLGADCFAHRMGRLLGYPDCCIEAFEKAGPGATVTDLIRGAYRRSRDFSWRLNCLDPLSPLNLIPHIPCSFDCKASSRMADSVLSALDGVFPFLDGTARELLGRPVLFLDADRMIAFEGEVDPGGRVLTYRSADRLCSRSHTDGSGTGEKSLDGVFSSIVRGNRITVDGHMLHIQSDGRHVTDWEADVQPLILPFTVMPPSR